MDSLSTVGWTRISKLRVNDHEVWQEVYHHYDPILRIFISRRLQRDRSDDNVNEVLSVTWAAIHEALTQRNGLRKFESGQHKFRKYLFTTARNTIANIFRRQHTIPIENEHPVGSQREALDLLIEEELFTLFDFVKRDLLIDGSLTQEQLSIVEDVGANDSRSLDHIAKKYGTTNNNISQINKRAMSKITTRFRQVHGEFSK